MSTIWCVLRLWGARGEALRVQALLDTCDVFLLRRLAVHTGDQLTDLLTRNRFGTQCGGFPLLDDQLYQLIEILLSKLPFQNIEQGEGVMVGDSRGVTLTQPVQGTGRNIWSIIHKVHFRCQKAPAQATVQKSTRCQG